MNTDRRRGAMRQNDWLEPDSVPLRDISPPTSASHEPASEEWRRSEERKRWDQQDDEPTWIAQSQSQRSTGAKLSTERERLVRAGVAGELKKHNLALILIIFYAFIAILSWSIICVLTYRPIGVPTYFDQSGNYSKTQYEMTDNWRRAASVGQSIVGVISIPITSAMCARAATVYCQRKSDARTPSLSLRQMLVLADKGWTDLATLSNVVRPSTSRRTRSPLLIVSASLVAIGFVIPIIRTSILGTEHVSILSWQDVEDRTILGVQTTPQILRTISNDSVMDNVISSIIIGKLSDKQPFLWSFDQNSSGILSVGQQINKSTSFGDIPTRQFIATLPVGTDTGVLRSLALRLNISIGCNLVSQSDFPSPCPGGLPLDQTFTNINTSTSTPFGDLDYPHYRTRICAPGNILSSPWNGTADRQDISENFWLDYQRTSFDAFEGDEDRWGFQNTGNYHQHCYGNSTLGYFELPNYWNGHVVGPLLDKVPPSGLNLTYQNGDIRQLTAGDWDKTPMYGVPGPFLTAILATFGPNSFFAATAANSNWTRQYSTLPLCAQLRYPFIGLDPVLDIILDSEDVLDMDWKPNYSTLKCPSTDPIPPLLRALMTWMPNFGDKEKAIAALTLATYAAGNAILNIGPESEFHDNLYTSPGTSIQKPNISLVGIAVVSSLLAVQIIGLTLLAIYASRNATWTASLDSFAMLRLGAEIGKENMPAVSALEGKNAKILDERTGWVGDTEVEGRQGEIEVRELGLGGQGRVRDKVLYRFVRVKDTVGEAS